MAETSAKDTKANTGENREVPRGATTNRGQTWATLCHLAAFSGFIGVPFGNLLGPLVVWLVKRDEYALVDEQGRESLNFQISMFLYSIGAAFLIFFCIGIVLLVALQILNFVLVIVASVKTANGEHYAYPLALPLLEKPAGTSPP